MMLQNVPVPNSYQDSVQLCHKLMPLLYFTKLTEDLLPSLTITITGNDDLLYKVAQSPTLSELFWCSKQSGWVLSSWLGEEK